MKDKKTENTQNTNSVDQIREILFGEQIAIFEKRFAQMEANLSQSITELSNTIKADLQKLEKQLVKTESNLQGDNTELAEQINKEIQSTSKTLNDKIVETESELTNQMQSGLESLDQKTSDNAVLAELLKDMADKLLSK